MLSLFLLLLLLFLFCVCYLPLNAAVFVLSLIFTVKLIGFRHPIFCFAVLPLVVLLGSRFS